MEVPNVIMNHFKKMLARLILGVMALVLVLGAFPAQAAKPNLAPAISPGPLNHREELRATVNARTKLARVQLRIDNKKVQPWVKAHAGWTYSIRYPLTKLAVGKHTAKLQVWDRKNRSTQRQWQFQKLAQLALSADRTNVQPGEKVTLSGSGFTPGTAITVGMGGQNTGVGGSYGSAVVGRNGAFTVEVTLDRYPDGSALHAGTISLVAHNRDGSEKAAVDLQVLSSPRIALDKSSIKPGDGVRVTGEGFTPGVAVSVSLGAPNTDAGGNYGSMVTDSTGRFALNARLTQLPDGSPLYAGQVILVAHTSDFREKAVAQLQILADPAISLDKTMVKAGEKVTVTGIGFTPGASVSVVLGGVNTGASGNYGDTMVDRSGRFSLDVLLDRYPDGSPLKPGTVVLLAHTADFSEKASAQLQVGASPTLIASKSTIRVGEWVVLNGEGFTPGKVVTIALAGVNMGHGDRYATAVVDAGGRFSTQLFLGRYPDGTPLPPGGVTLMAATADGEHALVNLQLVSEPAIFVNKSSIKRGDQVLVTGQDFTPFVSISMSMGSVNGGAGGNYGNAMADANGRFSLVVTPARYPDGSPLQPGTIVLVAHDPSWHQQASIHLQIVDGAPSAAADLRITLLSKGATSAEPTIVGLQWRDTSSGETGFHIQATFTRMNGGTDTQAWTMPANITTAQVSFVAGGINPVSKACFTVTAFNGRGDSPPSNQVCVAL